MNTKYIDLIHQTFDFPQEEFKVDKGQLHFHDIDLMQLTKQYGAPHKFQTTLIRQNSGLLML